MNDRAFVIVGDHAAVVANDVTDARYRAVVHCVPIGIQVPVRSHADAETVVMLEDGMLEFMIGGASAYVTAPQVVRVPPGVLYAYRNVGDHTAHLLVHTGKPGPIRKLTTASVGHAA